MGTIVRTLARTQRPTLGRALRWLEDALFPPTCLGCGRGGAWCCPACFASLRFARQLYCPACGEQSELGAFCAACGTAHALSGLWWAQPYGNPLVRDMVKAVKFEGLTELMPALGELMVATLTSYSLPPTWHGVPREVWRLTPVPLHRRRERGRGFNQADELARYVANRTGLTVLRALKRSRSTERQSELKDEERVRNVDGAFAASANALAADGAIILVDDVYTSGATMEACARALKAAGAREVWGLVVAKG